MKKNLSKLILASVGVCLISGLVSEPVFGIANNTDGQTRFQDARQNYLNEGSAFQNAQRTYQELELRFKNASTEQQNKLREQLREQAREYLKKRIGAMIKYLEAMKNKLTNSNKISETDRTALLSKLDEQINWLKAKQAEVSSADAQKLKEINQTVNERWKVIHLTARQLSSLILAARIRFIYEKGEAMLAQLEAKISDLAQAGKDVTKINSLTESYKNNLALAKDKYQAAKAKLQETITKDNASQIFQEAQKLLNEANKYVKQAHKDLVQITVRIKQLENVDKTKNATSTNATSTP